MMEQFQNVKFRQEDHSYWLGGERLTSATQFIRQFQEPFDWEGVSTKVAVARGITQEEVVAEWERKRQIGIITHQYINALILSESAPHPHIEPIMAEEKAFIGWMQDIPLFTSGDAQLGRNVWSEQVIGDAQIGVAGTVDLVLKDEFSCYRIIDFKSGNFTTGNVYENLLCPFDDLEASKLAVASLQTSMYRLILDRAGMKTLHPIVVHLKGDGTAIEYYAYDLRQDLLDCID